MNPRRLQRSLRLFTLVIAGLGGFYLWNRYELIDLPVEGCSPLRRIRPGQTLWIDLSPSTISAGDVVFFELPDGQLALAQVDRLASEPQRYWLLCDDPGCPGEDSDNHGWIPRELIHGRMMMAFDF